MKATKPCAACGKNAQVRRQKGSVLYCNRCARTRNPIEKPKLVSTNPSYHSENVEPGDTIGRVITPSMDFGLYESVLN